MIIRVRFKNISSNSFVSNWKLYSVSPAHSFHQIFNDIHAGTLLPRVDLSWADPESCAYYVAVTKEAPTFEDLQEVDALVSLEDVSENNRKVYLQCDLKQFVHGGLSRDSFVDESCTSTDSLDDAPFPSTSTSPAQQIIRPSIVDVLMRKPNHYPPMKEVNRSTGDVRQYNAFVKYLMDSRFGVLGGKISDYINFAKTFCNLLWEIDPHYHKLQDRGKSFPKVIEKLLGFNDPKRHGHKVGNISMVSIAVKLESLKIFSDRAYMNAPHMTRLSGILKSVIDKCSEYIDVLETQRVRSSENHNKSVELLTEIGERNLRDYITTEIKMKFGVSDGKYDSLKEALLNADFYEPIMISDILRDRRKNRSTYCRMIQDILTKGLPFKINDVILFHFKLPSQGPHQALHFIWKQPSHDNIHNESHINVICQLRDQKEKYYSRSMKKEIKRKLSMIGIIKPHQAVYIMKDLLGDESASENEASRDIQRRLDIALTSGDDIIVDLRSNNGRKPSFDAFWDIVADYLSEKTAVDDRRHGSVTENNDVVVNMCLSASYADMYRNCVKIAQSKNMEKIPSYAWFLCQFWPCSRSASAMLKYTGKFKIKKMIQARLLRKNNPDLHYARSILKFLRKRAINHRDCVSFISADAKCKINVGEPGYPLAAVSRGKQVIVGENEVFQVSDHDFSKLSIIPDGIFIHDIPDSCEDLPEVGETDYLMAKPASSDKLWYRGNAFYGLKTMVFEGSTALRGVVELGNVLNTKYSGQIPNRFYLITDGGGDRNIVHLSVQKYLVALFRKYNFDEIIAIRTAAGCSFYNPMERIHAVGNIGLQGVGVMRRRMSYEMEALLKKANSNEEIRKLCEKDPQLASNLKESLKMPVDLLRDVFGNLFMKDTTFQISDPATDEEIDYFLEYLNVFDDDIKDLRSKAKLNKYPLFCEFLKSHTDAKTYSFHVFKCNDDNCVYHAPLQGDIPQRFPQPVPRIDENGENEHYEEGYDPNEDHLPSKSKNVEKQSHNIPFTVSAQTAMNVGMTMVCKECGKPRLLYCNKKLKGNQLVSLKRALNGVLYVCGTAINEIDENEENRDASILKSVFARENINCFSKIEVPYYSCKGYKDLCIYCGGIEDLKSDGINFPKCSLCADKSDVKRMKRKTVLDVDLAPKKKKAHHS